MKPLRVSILGAGPAGMYAAVLLKNANPDHEITIFERNPAGATYGFGVVLSDRTLTAFRDADRPTYDAITSHQATWAAIDTFHRGVKVHCGGHYYLGIARKRLLDILQQRCAELGIIMRFGTEVTDLSAFADTDLIIAADGVNSLVRRTYADHFQPAMQPGGAKYIWLGTDWVPSAFTFIFHETEHGLFQAHIYPYEESASTCIVMCREETWQRAGLDRATEAESVAFCKELLRPYLGNAGFMSNRSLWYSFGTLRTTRWSHGKIVLIGDSAHTAHWSIGSGTKLAMEDAIALVQALQRHPDIPTALLHYELERKPVVEKLQRAGRISELYCENAERYVQLEPIQFAFQLMIRSGRIDYDNLRQRDPAFIGALERWFAGGAEALAPMETPLGLRELSLQNRVVMRYPVGGVLPDRRPGLILTETLAVSPEGRFREDSPGLYACEHASRWRELIGAVRAQGSVKVGVQIGHAGRRARHGDLIAPSPLAYGPADRAPRAAGVDDLARLREAFVQSARLADESGFDLLQLDMGHGGLLASFMSPLSNQRKDMYGGELNGRAQFPLEIYDAIRMVWPRLKPLSVSLSASDWAEGGLTVSEAVTVARMLKERGCDLVQVVAGETVALPRPVGWAALLTSYSEQIRNDVQIPTMIGDPISTSREGNTVIAGARADLVLMV